MIKNPEQEEVWYLQISRLARSGFILAILAAMMVILAGIGTRFGLWNFRTGLTILKWGGYIAFAAMGLLLIGVTVKRYKRLRLDFIIAGLGLLITLIILGVLGYWYWNARNVPPIHDITTDTESPPSFVAILPLRKNAPNPAEYGGQWIALQQQAGYPGLGPAILNIPPDQAFNIALSATRGMRWDIVEADSTAGRIEATDTTFWFGFKDDIVVRVSPADGGSRIDVRSVSRVGRSDVGTNAKRIERYLKKIKAG